MCPVVDHGDQPVSGGTPTSVILTIGLQELLAKAGLAETSDGSQLSAEQLLRIADEAEIWPTIINHNNIPLAMGRTRRIATPGPNHGLAHRDGGCSFPGVPIHPATATDTTFRIGSWVDSLIWTT